MSDKILLLEPVFMERIWGGSKLKELFNYNIPSNLTGEAWVISAHKDGSSKILNGDYKGKTLSWLYQNHKELFNNIKDERFPLLVKLLDAQSNLSVQVHPDDKMAIKYNDLGKTECWYVIDCSKDAKIIYGHSAKSKEEFRKLIDEDAWDKLLIEKPIKPGDFVFVPAGKIHAITAGTVILEIQQSSNVTFRLYDYNRLDDKGNKRELHIEESILASIIPDIKIENKSTKKIKGLNEIETLIKSNYFTVEKWNLKEKYARKNDSFILASVINGMGKINNLDIKKGSNFIITSDAKEFEIIGELEIVVSYL